MGCCSSTSVPAKDPEDKTLDDVDMAWVWIHDFDTVFSAAADPLNTAVGLNNGIITSFEKIKEAAAAIFGANIIKLEFSDNQVKIGVYSVDDDGEETELTGDKLEALYTGSNGANFQGAWNAVLQQRDALNTSLTTAPQVAVEVKKGGRLFAKVGETTRDDEANVSTARGNLAGFNNLLFKAKLELTRASAEQALNPKTALVEIFSNLKKHITSFVPRVDVDLSALADGNGRFDVRLPDFDPKILPHKIRVAYLAIFSESVWDTGLIPTIKDCISQIASLNDQFKAAQEAVEGLPKDIAEAAQAANVSMSWLPRAAARVASNSKEVANAPAILNQLLDTIRWSIEEVQGAINELP